MVKLASYTLPSDLEQLGEEIAELAAHLQVVTYLLLVRLREFDAREGWSGGFRSCAHWLSWRTGIELGAAREKAQRRAHALALVAADALRAGSAADPRTAAADRYHVVVQGMPEHCAPARTAVSPRSRAVRTFPRKRRGGWRAMERAA